MRYQIFSLVVILLIISLIWTSQVSSNTKEELNNDLIRAAHDGQTEKVLDLIKAGADVNVKDNHGYTALMAAASAGRTETVKALIDAKADVNARDEKNKTALDWAKGGNVKVIKILKSAGAKDNP